MKDLNAYTLQEFLDMPTEKPTETFASVIIVPTDEIHDSGFRCMKFILTDGDQIVGVVNTGSDVVWPNGVGNYGRNRLGGFMQRIPYMGLHMDCLTESRCVRIMLSKKCVLNDFIGSDFIFYTVEEE